MKRIFVIVLALTLAAAIRTPQGARCRDFTLGVTQQIESCTTAIGTFGVGGTPNGVR